MKSVDELQTKFLIEARHFWHNKNQPFGYSREKFFWFNQTLNFLREKRILNGRESTIYMLLLAIRIEVPE